MERRWRLADQDMPVSRVAEFYGIVVEMFHNEHRVPHFHAKYAEHKAIVAIESRSILAGELPRRTERLVLQWALLHHDERRDNWDRARASEQVLRIDPLD